MAKIKTYIIDTNITDEDIIIGSDADNNNETKNFNVGALRTYMLSGLEPEVGGNLKITTIVDNDSEETTPEDYFNNSVTPIIVLHYEIVFLILNGKTFIFRKNNDTYGVDETQVVSGDFTEIDITSVITANLQDIDSVLFVGNQSPEKDLKLNRLYLWNNNSDTDYGSYVEGSKDRVNFHKNDGTYLGAFDDKRLLISVGGYEYRLNLPTISALTEATFQNTSGTVAYLTDIPEIPVLDIESPDDSVLVSSVDGVFSLTVPSVPRAYIKNTLLRDSITNTTIVDGGGSFEYDESVYPIDSIRFTFNDNIESLILSGVYGRVYIHKENGVLDHDLLFSDATISANTITFDFPMSEYWSLIVGERIEFLDVTLKPSCLKVIDGEDFDGSISGCISRYIYKW